MSRFIVRRHGDGRALRVRLDGGASWVHPDALADALDALCPPDAGPNMTAWFAIREAVGLIDHIARHPAGTESIIKQIRQYRRRIKAADSPTTPNPDGLL